MQNKNTPLAARLRPSTLNDFVGQAHLLAEGKPLWQALQAGQPHSMILWGPPGTGKTTLARLLAKTADTAFISISAVMSGLKDVREAIDKATELAKTQQQKTILFVDEVHRFNKNQQDVFLPYVENGTIIFIGATTENPSFEINNALLSRCRVYVLKSLTEQDLLEIIDRALTHSTLSTELNLPQITKQFLLICPCENY
jgi:putative ATPase